MKLDFHHFLMLAGILSWMPVRAAVTAADFADLTIEQLMNESVTSVSKRETSLDRSPAAISVVTTDDIRRLGIASIPEALRLVPGLDVARINASQWAVSSRGFNLQYSNKLLVMMDGRSVYTPSFGGVYWDAQDMVLDDLERIEVIRGPGATLWGANAVNGVINITSKNSKDTQGGLVSTTAGSGYEPSTSVRYGGQLSDDLHYRVYLKYLDTGSLVDRSGHDAPDAWNSIRGGFRTDWQPAGDDMVTFQGDWYSLQTGENVTSPEFLPPYSRTVAVENESNGGNLLGRWTRNLSEVSHFSFQAYFDSFKNGSGVSGESRETVDFQFEQRLPLGSRNDVMWGLGYRFTTDELTDTAITRWANSRDEMNLLSAFLQDEITLFPRRLNLILGSKLEHNDYTAWEIQPSARLLWTPDESQTVWLSASRAAGTPARLYRDARVNLAVVQPPRGPLVEAAWIGNGNFISETVNAFELGYRVEPTPNFSVDLAAFYNVYDNLLGVIPGAAETETDPVPHVLLPYQFANNVAGETYGTEVTVQWKPMDQWRLTAGCSWLHMRLHPSDTLEKGSPQQQFSLRSYVTLPWNLEFNSFASFVDEIESLTSTGSTTPVPAYVRVDAGLIWHRSRSMEIGVWGQNLLDNQHPEFSSQGTGAITEIPRSIVVRATWNF